MSGKKNLSKEDIIHLGKLASLSLTDAEIKKYEEQFSETLDYIKNLEELNTEAIKPTNHTTELVNTGFEDGEKNERHLSQENALKNSKNKKGNYFVVKRLIAL